MDTIFHTLEQLLPTLLIIWLPIDDITIKSVLSYSITKLIIDLIKLIGNLLKGFLKYLPVINYYKKNYIKINYKMLQYENLLLYISEKYDSNIVGYCAHCDEDNEIKYDIDEINKIYLNDMFEHEGKIYKIFLQTDKNMIEGKYKKLEHEILVKGNCGTNILKKYIENIHFTMSEKIVSKQNALKIFRMNYDVDNGKKKVFKGWKKYICLTNKTIKNTVPSNAVKAGFLDAIEDFIQSAEKYKLRGLPYKIGFALYGEPGCGKTSIVKAVAQHHNIPIFIINLDVIKDNDTLVKVTNMVSNHVTSGKLHILLFEDVDRCKIFRNNNNYYNDKSNCLSMNTLLNILDGVDETHGRINILSANNIKKLENDNALLRPGRIDKVIHMTKCCDDQIEKILEIFFPGCGNNVANKLNTNIEITPAILTQIIITLNDIDKIVKFLNKHVTFNNMNYNELFNNMSKYITSKKNNVNDVNNINNSNDKIGIEDETNNKENDISIDSDNYSDNFNDIVPKKRNCKKSKKKIVKHKQFKIMKKQSEKIIDNIMIYKHLIAKQIAANDAKLEELTLLLGQEKIINDITCIKLNTENEEYKGDLKIINYYYDHVTKTFNVKPDDVLVKMLIINDKFIRKGFFGARRHTLEIKEILSKYCRQSTFIKSIITYGTEIIDLQRYNFNGCNYQLLYELYEKENKKTNDDENVINSNDDIQNPNDDIQNSNDDIQNSNDKQNNCNITDLTKNKLTTKNIATKENTKSLLSRIKHTHNNKVSKKKQTNKFIPIKFGHNGYLDAYINNYENYDDDYKDDDCENDDDDDDEYDSVDEDDDDEDDDIDDNDDNDTGLLSS